MATTVAEIIASTPTPITKQLTIEKERRPESTETLDLLNHLSEQRLYHQFLDAAERYLDPREQEQQQRRSLPPLERASFVYNVLFPLRDKMNPLRLIKILEATADSLNPEEGLTFLSVFEAPFIDDATASMVFAIVKAGQLIRKNDLPAAQTILFKEVGAKLAKEVSVDIPVNAGYHKTCAAYYKAMRDDREFYESCVLFLAYTPLVTLTTEERLRYGEELCVSGLLAVGMYDFGDLMQHPLVTNLKEAEDKAWLLDFVDAATQGSLQMVTKAMEKHKKLAEATFGEKMATLQEKMVILALIEFLFRQPKSRRRVTFQEIAEHCHTPLKEVELLLMKAMSHDLIRGSIDGIDSTVTVTWVKPRILDLQRVSFVRSRLINWAQNVQTLVKELEEITPELLVA